MAEMDIAGFILCQKGNFALSILILYLDNGPDDRLNALCLHFFRKFKCPEHIKAVGDGKSRLSIHRGQLGQLGNLQRAFR